MSARIRSIPAGSSDDPVVNSLIDFAKNGFGDTQMFGLVARRPRTSQACRVDVRLFSRWRRRIDPGQVWRHEKTRRAP